MPGCTVKMEVAMEGPVQATTTTTVTAVELK